VQLKDLPIGCAGFAAMVRFDTFPRVEAGVVNSPRQCSARRCEERPADLTGAGVGTVLDKKIKENGLNSRARISVDFKSALETGKTNKNLTLI
jgi:hypothetical protein